MYSKHRRKRRTLLEGCPGPDSLGLMSRAPPCFSCLTAHHRPFWLHLGLAQTQPQSHHLLIAFFPDHRFLRLLICFLSVLELPPLQTTLFLCPSGSQQPSSILLRLLSPAFSSPWPLLVPATHPAPSVPLTTWHGKVLGFPFMSHGSHKNTRSLCKGQFCSLIRNSPGAVPGTVQVLLATGQGVSESACPETPVQ